MLGALLAACGTPATHGGEPPPAIGTLVAPVGTPYDFGVDHRITLRWEGGEQSFRAVLEKRGDTLTIVGLGPHGGRGFVLREEGTEVSFESHLPEPLPFPPEHILLTVQRTWLAGVATTALPDGEHRISRDGEEIVETWARGLLLRRTFRREDDTPPGIFAIDYGTGMAPDPSGATPGTITITDGWMHFEIVLDAITRQPLPPI